MDVKTQSTEPEAPVFSDADYDDLVLLRWASKNLTKYMTDESRSNLWMLETRLREYQAWQKAERLRPVRHLATPERLDELEERLKAGGNIESEEEALIWEAGVEAWNQSAPVNDAPDEVWASWYATPVSAFVPARRATWATGATEATANTLRPRTAALARNRAPRSRRRTVRTSRGPDESDEPEPPRGRQRGNRARSNTVYDFDAVLAILARSTADRRQAVITCGYCLDHGVGDDIAVCRGTENALRAWWQDHPCSGIESAPQASVDADRLPQKTQTERRTEHRSSNGNDRRFPSELSYWNEVIDLAMAAASTFSANSGRRIVA